MNDSNWKIVILRERLTRAAHNYCAAYLKNLGYEKANDELCDVAKEYGGAVEENRDESVQLLREKMKQV